MSWGPLELRDCRRHRAWTLREKGSISMASRIGARGGKRHIRQIEIPSEKRWKVYQR